MAEHYTRNTVEATSYCRKCKKFTMHLVQGGLIGACEVCLKKPAEPEKPPPAKQESLF